MPSFIRDGFTLEGYIAEQPRLHDALEFTYRPMMIQARSMALAAISRATDPRKADTLAAHAIASHVLEWDLKDDNKREVEITAEMALHLQPSLFSRLWSIITGSDASDARPGEKTQADSEREEAEFKAAMAGQSLEEFTAKNSEAG